MSETGTVQFRVPGLPFEAGNAIEVRDTSLALVARAACYDSLELAPGTYIARVVLPSGEQPEQVITLAPGATVAVQFGDTETGLGPSSSRSAGGVSGRGEPGDDSPGDEDRVFDEVGSESGLLGQLLESESRRPRHLAYEDLSVRSSPTVVRWFSRIIGFARESASPEPVEIRQTRVRHALGAQISDFEYASSAPQIFCLQVATHGGTPFNCMLPMLSSPPYGPGRCRVRVTATPEAVRAAAVPMSLSQTDLVETVAAYMSKGHLHHAAEIAANARVLLLEKLRDPIGATLGGYALLRLGLPAAPESSGMGAIDPDEIMDWATNLANWFPVLPDGAVIAGELAARLAASDSRYSPERRQAKKWMAEAAQRGVPVFADGLSLLATRLREWRSAPYEGYSAREREAADWLLRPEATGTTIDRILSISLAADFTQIVSTFSDPDPAFLKPSPESSDFNTGERWQALGDADALGS